MIAACIMYDASNDTIPLSRLPIQWEGMVAALPEAHIRRAVMRMRPGAVKMFGGGAQPLVLIARSDRVCGTCHNVDCDGIRHEPWAFQCCKHPRTACLCEPKANP